MLVRAGLLGALGVAAFAIPFYLIMPLPKMDGMWRFLIALMWAGFFGSALGAALFGDLIRGHIEHEMARGEKSSLIARFVFWLPAQKPR